MKNQKTMCALTALLFTGALAAPAAAGTSGMYAWNSPGKTLWSVDVTGPSSTQIGTPGGNDQTFAEIEYGDGVLYGSNTPDGLLSTIDLTTGLVTSTLTFSFPAEGDAITSMEYIDGTLYAGLTNAGGGPTYLSTIDTTTGQVNVIGSTPIANYPLGGLAWNGSTLYGVTAGGSYAKLYSIDLGTGIGTPLGTALRTPDGQDIFATGLEFGADGTLYGLTNSYDFPFSAGHLLSIDASTQIATDLGRLNESIIGFVALTNVEIPAPSGLALLGLAGFGCRRRRRA